MALDHFLLTDERKCLKDSESDWESEVNSESEADSKLESDDSKLLMFTKVNFTSKPPAQLSSLTSMTASQADKVAPIVDPAVVAWEVWKQMLDQKQSNKLWKNIIYEH